MLYDGRVMPHIPIHGGRENHGTLCGEEHGREEIVGQPERGFRQAIGGGRGYQDSLRLFRQGKVQHFLVGFEEVGGHVGTGQHLEGQRGHEPAGPCRHDDVHRRAFATEQAQEPDCLIGGYTPRDGEHKVDTGE